MIQPDNSPAPNRILILMSDTGGGHRAAAEAIRDALYEKYPGEMVVTIVDVFVDYGPYPFSQAPDLYPLWINRGKLSWRVGFHFSNWRLPIAIMNAFVTWRLARGLRRLFADHPADVVVNVHPFLATPALRILQEQPDRPKFITVVTDLVSAHRVWYEPGADRTLVPTEGAYRIGIRRGVPADRLRVTGLPVHPRFAAGLVDKQTARAALHWAPTLPAVMVIGGGSGIGPLYEIATALDTIPAPCQIVVVAGRNTRLAERLQAHHWRNQAHIYGFMTNMPELMAAADLLVTKAGPATLSEACMAGLPVILSDAIPGQEVGNVRYIVDNGAGLYASTPQKTRAAVADWLSRGPAFLAERSAAAARLAKADAVWVIAAEIRELALRR